MLARYFLFQHGRQWVVTLEGRVMGRYGSRTEATEAAVVMADLMGAMHHDADVMLSDDGALELIWTFGHDRPSRRTHRRKRAEPRPPAGHVVRIQRAAQAP